MKYTIIIVLFLMTLTGCNVRSSNSDTINDSIVQKLSMGKCQGKHIIVFKNNRISFFGETLVMDDSSHIMQQISDIASVDDMLMMEEKVLHVGEVGFGINLNDDGIILISSAQADDPKIRQVIKYLNGIYGTAREEDPDNLWWCAEEPNDSVCNKTIRLRPMHSEDGGMVIMFH